MRNFRRIALRSDVFYFVDQNPVGFAYFFLSLWNFLIENGPPLPQECR